MKHVRFALIIILLSLASAAFAQDAKKSFDSLKSLAGSWQGTITTDPKSPEIDGKTMNVTLRVTSMGNALMHEMTGAGRPDDPITMFYLDGDKLTLTHFCDAGNRPHMTAKASDGKSLDFELADVSGGNQHGHMHHVLITILDANHHTEEWTFMLPGGKAVTGHVDLQRTK